MCAFPCPGANQRMWALHKLRKLMSAYCGPLINVNALLSSPTSESPEPEVPRPFHMVSEPSDQWSANIVIISQ